MSDGKTPFAEVTLTEQDVRATLECLRSGWLTMGPRTEAFEQALARYIGTPHALTVSSATAALQLCLILAGVGLGDEVILPALGSATSAGVVSALGATPVFCEICSAQDLNLDVGDLAGRITPSTRAVIAAHLSGYPAAVNELRALCDLRDLVLIEDCTQAIGATVDDTGRQVGTIGDLGFFSLRAGGQLCVGEGAIVSSASEQFADRLRLLRSHAMSSGTWERHRGGDPVYDVVDIGYNYRLDEPRAALGLSRLGRLEDENRKRRELSLALRERLAGREGLELAFDAQAAGRSAPLALPLLLADCSARDLFCAQLDAGGIQTARYLCTADLAGLGLSRAREAFDRHCLLGLSVDIDQGGLEQTVAAVDVALTGLG